MNLHERDSGTGFKLKQTTHYWIMYSINFIHSFQFTDTIQRIVFGCCFFLFIQLEIAFPYSNVRSLLDHKIVPQNTKSKNVKKKN